MKSQETYEQIKQLWLEFELNHNLYQEKGTKAAAGRARKALGEIKKLVTPYKQASVEEGKK